MSGHSHFKTIKAQKEAADAKKGKVFSKMGRLIAIAAKDGGDPTKNAKLKTVIDQARRFNMPKDNIERAIKKGTGELESEKLEEVSYEAFGPGGVALIVEAISDNTNRTLTDVKTIVNKNNGKMAGEGAVRWMFERKGVIVVSTDASQKEPLELTTIELGAEDIIWQDEVLEIHTALEDFDQIKKSLEEKGLQIESAVLAYLPKEEVVVSEKDRETIKKLLKSLGENDDVQQVYSNMKE